MPLRGAKLSGCVKSISAVGEPSLSRWVLPGRRALLVSMGVMSGQGCPSYGESRARDVPPTGENIGPGMSLLPGKISGQGCPAYRGKSGQGCPSYRGKSGQGCPAYRGKYRDQEVSPTGREELYRDRDGPPTGREESYRDRDGPLRDRDGPPTGREEMNETL